MSVPSFCPYELLGLRKQPPPTEGQISEAIKQNHPDRNPWMSAEKSANFMRAINVFEDKDLHVIYDAYSVHGSAMGWLNVNEEIERREGESEDYMEVATNGNEPKNREKVEADSGWLKQNNNSGVDNKNNEEEAMRKYIADLKKENLNLRKQQIETSSLLEKLKEKYDSCNRTLELQKLMICKLDEEIASLKMDIIHDAQEYRIAEGEKKESNSPKDLVSKILQEAKSQGKAIKETAYKILQDAKAEINAVKETAIKIVEITKAETCKSKNIFGQTKSILTEVMTKRNVAEEMTSRIAEEAKADKNDLKDLLIQLESTLVESKADRNEFKELFVQAKSIFTEGRLSENNSKEPMVESAELKEKIQAEDGSRKMEMEILKNCLLNEKPPTKHYCREKWEEKTEWIELEKKREQLRYEIEIANKAKKDAREAKEGAREEKEKARKQIEELRKEKRDANRYKHDMRKDTEDEGELLEFEKIFTPRQKLTKRRKKRYGKNNSPVSSNKWNSPPEDNSDTSSLSDF